MFVYHYSCDIYVHPIVVYWGENKRDRKKMKKIEWKNNECDKWGDKEREREKLEVEVRWKG